MTDIMIVQSTVLGIKIEGLLNRRVVHHIKYGVSPPKYMLTAEHLFHHFS